MQNQVHISEFSKRVNLPILSYLDSLGQVPCNQNKQKISFLSGDPTVYGQKSFMMPQEGNDIVHKNIMNQKNHGYGPSSGISPFKKSILKLYQSKVPVQQSDVFVHHGANMTLLNILMAFTNQNDQILVPQIGYPFFHDLCPALKRKAVPYRLIKQKNFEIDLEHVQSLITQRTSFMYLINPTNPIGTVFSKKHMQQILNFANTNELPIVVDEVYHKMVFPGVQYLSFGDLTEDAPVIVVSGVEKMLTVPGWVQSWAVIFDKNHYLKHIKQNLAVTGTIFLHTNVFTQHSLVEILQKVGLFTSTKMDIIEEKFKKLSNKVNEIKGLTALPAQATIYLAVEIDFLVFKDITNDREFTNLLRVEENMDILPLSVCGNLQGLRLLTCAQQELYDQFIARLKQFIIRHEKK